MTSGAPSSLIFPAQLNIFHLHALCIHFQLQHLPSALHLPSCFLLYLHNMSLLSSCALTLQYPHLKPTSTYLAPSLCWCHRHRALFFGFAILLLFLLLVPLSLISLIASCSFYLVNCSLFSGSFSFQ